MASNALTPPPTVPGSHVKRLPGPGLRLEIEGNRCVLDARIRRLFPLTSPDRLLAVLDRDGKQAALLAEIETADPETRAALEAALDRAYATPRIERIDALKLETGMWRFNVETDRGPSEFFVRHWRDSAFELNPGRWMIFSVEGVRYEIPDLEALDPASRRLMDLLI